MLRKRKKTKNKLFPAWLVMFALLDPHLFFGMLDFFVGLQASRPRFDEGWMLEAENTQSGNPPALSCRL